MKQNELAPLGFEVVDLSEIELLRGGGQVVLGCYISGGQCGGAPGGGGGSGSDLDAGCSRANGMCPGGTGCGIANGMCHDGSLI